jgi:hypothetical protein
MTPTVLIVGQAKAAYFEAAAKGRDAKLTANWVPTTCSAVSARTDWRSRPRRSRRPTSPPWSP